LSLFDRNDYPMPDSSTPKNESVFVCACEDWMRSACAGKSFYRAYEGKRYCVLHLPCEDKSPEFGKAVQQKLSLNDFNFSAVWFPNSTSFQDCNFGTDANFAGAIFNDTVDFSRSEFAGVSNFDGAVFKKAAVFSQVTFKHSTSFQGTQFLGYAHFGRAKFEGRASFSISEFAESVIFLNAVFKEHVDFFGVRIGGTAAFQYAKFSNIANFERSMFHGADFSHVSFEHTSNFSECGFETNAVFTSACFNDDACFRSAKFRRTDYYEDIRSKPFERYRNDFSSAVFKQTVDFSLAHLDADVIAFNLARFEGDADFSSCYFQGSHESTVTNFESAVFFKRANFADSRVESPANFSLAKFLGAVSFSSASFSGTDLNRPDFGRAEFHQDADFSFAKFLHYGVNLSSGVFLEDVAFRATVFEGGGDFAGVTFVGNADFTSAYFKDSAYFNPNLSSDNSFEPTSFKKGAIFDKATFDKDLTFSRATFYQSAYFRGASFLGDTDFSDATFNSDAIFASATFASYLRFSGENFRQDSVVSLEHSLIKKPEHISFHALHLRPNWFINVDVRKFELIEIDWGERRVEDEINFLLHRRKISPYRALSISYRGLALNSEENHRYEEASNFRYMAMEARRFENWRGFAPWSLSWWYWLASGYGERITRAALVLLGIWIFSGLIYTHVGFARWEPKLASEGDAVAAQKDDIGAPLKFSRALTHSAGVMMLQKPEPKPATTAAQMAVLLELILGPVQAALLALAIRRKFMR
jgi:uncharacterized protein YjbI with pentapeptide repeats